MTTVGILGGLGQIFLTESYRHADTSVIAPFEYSTMLWAVVIGFVLFATLALLPPAARSATSLRPIDVLVIAPTQRIDDIAHIRKAACGEALTG